jgi:hypothetical protein
MEKLSLKIERPILMMTATVALAKQLLLLGTSLGDFSSKK